VTRNAQTARQAHLYRGIFPVLYTEPPHDVWAEDVDLRVNFAMDMGESPRAGRTWGEIQVKLWANGSWCLELLFREDSSSEMEYLSGVQLKNGFKYNPLHFDWTGKKWVGFKCSVV